ncbi:MAG: maleylpyruvate isomerase N-terminal domain-containing protein, partial [Chloroflexi bacterium]|nr:maleylpyruvate isomerase N-terminal domain-containing protein [Chloroflexota bacterium]
MDDRVVARARQADDVLTSLGQYVEGLSPDEWQGPSDCAGWSVANVLAHLVLVTDLLGTAMERGLAGEGGPRPEIVADVAGWRQRRAQEVQRLSRLPRSELLSDLRRGLGRMNRAQARVAEAGEGGSGWHPSAGRQPLPWFAGQWLYEVALH